MERPVGVVILAILSILFAIPAFSRAEFFFRYADQEGMVALYWGFRSMNVFYVLSAIFLLFGICCAINAYGLWNLRRWARLLTIVLLAGTSYFVGSIETAESQAITALAWILALLAIDALIVIYLFSPRVTQAFKRE